MTRRAAALLFLFGLTTAFVLTHLPGGSVPKIRWTDMIPGADKIVHAGLYFWLAVFLANCLRFRLHSNRIIVATTMLVLAVYAAFDEWSQQFSPHRHPDVYDFAADMAGGWCGVSLFVVFRWYRHRRRTCPVSPSRVETVPPHESLEMDSEAAGTTSRPTSAKSESRNVNMHVPV